MMKSAQKYSMFFEQITQDTPIEEYRAFFDENSCFEDPFQKVVGVDKIFAVFENMYETLHNPSFIVQECVSEANVSYIKWNFLYQMNEGDTIESFVGVSRVLFGENNKVISHIDYWDAAVNVYEKIPILGAVLRFIKRKIHA